VEVKTCEAAFGACKKPNAFYTATFSGELTYFVANTPQDRDSWISAVASSIKHLKQGLSDTLSGAAGIDATDVFNRQTPSRTLKGIKAAQQVQIQPQQRQAYYWTPEEVNQWMHQLTLKYNYYDLLIEDGIDGEVLIDHMLTEQDWKELGLTLATDIDHIMKGRMELLNRKV